MRNSGPNNLDAHHAFVEEDPWSINRPTNPQSPPTPASPARRSLTTNRRLPRAAPKATPRGPSRKPSAVVRFEAGQARHDPASSSMSASAGAVRISSPAAAGRLICARSAATRPSHEGERLGKLVFAGPGDSTPGLNPVTVSIKPDAGGTARCSLSHAPSSSMRPLATTKPARLDRIPRQSRTLRRRLNKGSIPRRTPCNGTTSCRARNGLRPTRHMMAREKEPLTQAREAQGRRNAAKCPGVKVDKDYVFDGPDGKGDARRSLQESTAARWCST